MYAAVKPFSKALQDRVESIEDRALWLILASVLKQDCPCWGADFLSEAVEGRFGVN